MGAHKVVLYNEVTVKNTAKCFGTINSSPFSAQSRAKIQS